MRSRTERFLDADGKLRYDAESLYCANELTDRLVNLIYRTQPKTEQNVRQRKKTKTDIAQKKWFE